MHSSVHGGYCHDLVLENFVPRNHQRIGRVGTALGFLALGDQLKQHGGPDLDAPGIGMTGARHQVWPGKCEKSQKQGPEVYRFQPRFFIYPPGSGDLKTMGGCSNEQITAQGQTGVLAQNLGGGGRVRSAFGSYLKRYPHELCWRAEVPNCEPH